MTRRFSRENGAVSVWKHRFDRSRLITSFAVVLGATLIFIGLIGSVTGREQSDLPDQIERIQPVRGDKVLSQSSLVVDLVSGYGGRLEIDGVPYPTLSTQEPLPVGAPGASGPAGSVAPVPLVDDPNAVRFDAGTNTLSFQPRPDAEIERFEVGQHFVRVVYWKLVDGEAVSRSYTWYFDVTA